MRRKIRTKKLNRHNTKLGLPDLAHVKSAVLVSLRSPESQRSYRRSIEDFVSWCNEPLRTIIILATMTGLRIGEILRKKKVSWFSKLVVGAPRFELGTSCAQGRRNSQNNPPVFNVAAETERLSRDRRMWLAVRECLQMFVRWAQKLAHSKWYAYAGPRFIQGIARRRHASYEKRLSSVGWDPCCPNVIPAAVQLYKVLTANFDFAFVLTRSRQVVGQLHLQPRLRRAPERIIPLKAENDAPICPYRHGPQPPQVAFEWVQARLEEACENI
jgi:hypothetical protein